MYTLNNVLPIEATSRNKPTARAHVHVNSRDTERPCNKREDISTETAMLEISFSANVRELSAAIQILHHLTRNLRNTA